MRFAFNNLFVPSDNLQVIWMFVELFGSEASSLRNSEKLLRLDNLKISDDNIVTIYLPVFLHLSSGWYSALQVFINWLLDLLSANLLN